MNEQQEQYLDSIFGKQFDNSNWIYYDGDTITIEEVNGETQEWSVKDIQKAINGNQGETKRALINLKNLEN